MLPNGDRYEGEWQDGRPHGSGLYQCKDGRCIVGVWDRGRCLPKTITAQAGVAVYDESSMFFSVVCTDGTRIHGGIDWSGFAGTCFCLHPDGSSYSGQYKHGHANGHGVLTLVDGQRYDGQWLCDRRHGHGFLLYADGSRWQGEWRDDQRHSGTTVTHGWSIPATAGPCACAACLFGDTDAWAPAARISLGPHARDFLDVSLGVIAYSFGDR
jgi:hypothetical protein